VLRSQVILRSLRRTGFPADRMASRNAVIILRTKSGSPWSSEKRQSFILLPDFHFENAAENLAEKPLTCNGNRYAARTMAAQGSREFVPLDHHRTRPIVRHHYCPVNARHIQGNSVVVCSVKRKTSRLLQTCLDNTFVAQRLFVSQQNVKISLVQISV
jgi:hypothetical protein